MRKFVAVAGNIGVGKSMLVTERKGMTLHSFVGLSAQALSRLRVEVKEIYQSKRDLLLSI